MKPIAITKNLSFAYGLGTETLHGVNLTVEAGTFHALLGSNGAGKTTLLKVLAGLLRPGAGSAEVLGKDCQRLEADDWTQIGYVSESQPLYDWMKGRELIAFTRALYPNWDDGFCDKLARTMRLPLARKVRSYSKGERMKMALLLGMAFHPRLLILDEPFSGLDVLAKEQLIACLLEVTEQEQWSVVLASHDLAEVERLADTIGLIEHGRLRISEPIERLQGRFRRVQGFRPVAWLEHTMTMLRVEKNGEGVRFIETAFSPEREAELRAQLGADVAITPLALREIVLALLTEMN